MLNYTSRTRRTQWLVALGMFVPLIVLLVSTWLAFRSLRAQDAALLSVTESVDFHDALVHIKSGVIDMESCQRGFLLTGREDYLAPYASARSVVETSMIQLMKFVQGRPEQSTVQTELRPLVERKLEFADRVIRSKQGGSAAELRALLDTDAGLVASAGIRKSVDQMIRDEELSISAKDGEAGEIRQHTEMILVSLLVLDFVVIVLVIVLLARMMQMSRCVTMCAWSKKVQNDEEWIAVHEYLDKFHGVTVTHGISEEEREKFMAGLGVKPCAMGATAV